MECTKKRNRSSSAFKHLAEQVDEQSELCDFTVKVEHWEKKFHRCVLAACPYFEKIITGNFVEKKTGLVEIKHGTTSNCVDMALMFLYGRRPDITSDNVGGLLELAEYFMIKDLKSTCKKWFRSVDVTENNCMWIMQLSSKYNFEIKSCITYIESHLHEVFQNKEALNLSKESVEYMFSDRRFSYVTNDDKLAFLAKWVNANSEEESKSIIALFKTIDMQEVSKSALENAKSNAQFDGIINFDQAMSLTEHEITKHNVLIVPCEEGLRYCLDLDADRWHRFNSPVLENEFLQRYGIDGVRGSLPEMYFTECNLSEQDQWHIEICSVNLENDQKRTLKFQLTPEETTGGEILRDEPKHIHLTNDIVLATFNIMVPFIQNSKYKKRATNPLARDLANQIPFSLVDDPDEEMDILVPLKLEPENEEILPLGFIIIPQDTEKLSSTFTTPSFPSTSSRNEIQLPSNFDLIMQQISSSSSLMQRRKEELATTYRTNQQTESLQSYNVAQQGDTFPSTSNIMKERQEELPSTSRERERPTGSSSIGFIQTETFPPTSYSKDQQRVRFNRQSEVYVGHVSEEIAEMVPLFVLRNEHIAQACLNNHSTIGLLTKSLKYVILFDLINFKMDKILIQAVEDGDYTMVPTDLGFKIYNSKRCYSITRSGAGENQLTEFMFENEEYWNARYHYFNGIWIKLLRHQYNNGVKLYCIFDAMLSRSNSTKDIIWKPLNLPDNIYSFGDFDEIFVVLLSKSKLRCDIECPHCELTAPRYVPDSWNYVHMFLRNPSDSNSGSSYFGDSD